MGKEFNYDLKHDITYFGVFDYSIEHPNRLMEGTFYDLKKINKKFYRDNILCGEIKDGNLTVFKEIHV